MHGQVKKHKKQARDLGRRQRHQRDNDATQRLIENLNGVRIPAWSALSPGTVVQARVPFRERNDSKVRPALVTGRCGQRVVLRILTTKEHHALRYGGGEEVYLNGRRSWIAIDEIMLERVDIVGIMSERYDEHAFATVA